MTVDIFKVNYRHKMRFNSVENRYFEEEEIFQDETSVYDEILSRFLMIGDSFLITNDDLYLEIPVSISNTYCTFK